MMIMDGEIYNQVDKEKTWLMFPLSTLLFESLQLISAIEIKTNNKKITS